MRCARLMLKGNSPRELSGLLNKEWFDMLFPDGWGVIGGPLSGYIWIVPK